MQISAPISALQFGLAFKDRQKALQFDPNPAHFHEPALKGTDENGQDYWVVDGPDDTDKTDLLRKYDFMAWCQSKTTHPDISRSIARRAPARQPRLMRQAQHRLERDARAGMMKMALITAQLRDLISRLVADAEFDEFLDRCEAREQEKAKP